MLKELWMFCCHSSLSILLSYYSMTSHTFFYIVNGFVIKRRYKLRLGLPVCVLQPYHLQMCSYPARVSESSRAASGLTLHWRSFVAGLAASQGLWCCVRGMDGGPWQQLHIAGERMNKEGEIKMVNHKLWALFVELYSRALCRSVSMHSEASQASFSPGAAVIIIVTKGDVWCNNSHLSWGFGRRRSVFSPPR